MRSIVFNLFGRKNLLVAQINSFVSQIWPKMGKNVQTHTLKRQKPFLPIPNGYELLYLVEIDRGA